ncbi:MAG: DsbA family protein [Anaerolineales bacterium]|nr:DsbA family protein [Anaerolineales bacterium]
MTSREAIKERRRQQKKQQRLVTLMVVAGIALIFAAILMIPGIGGAFSSDGDFVKPELNPKPQADRTAMGDPNAPVTMVIISDFGCSHCANFAEGSGNRIAEEYVSTGQVYLVYRSSGDLLPNSSTAVAAEAAYCAADQGKFWEYHDLLFANQIKLFSTMGRDNSDTFNAFAEYLQMDLDQFERCMDEGKYKDQIVQDRNDALEAGINSTPSFLINGQLVVGNVPYSEFQRILEAELAAAQN